MSASAFDPLAKLSPVVLPRTQAGSGKQTGLEICAAFTSDLRLVLTLTNFSSSILSGFAIQLNKNFFGFAPAAPLALAPLSPGASAEVTLQVLANQNLSDKAPSFPLVLQVALKTSLDVFYFNVPYELFNALVHTGARADAAGWPALWQGTREAADFQVRSSRVWDSETLSRAMQSEAFFAISRERDAFCFAGTTVTGARILARVGVGAELRVEVKSDRAELVTLAVAQLNKLLG